MLLYEILYVCVVCFLSGGRFHTILRNLVCERGLFPSLVIVLMLFYGILYVSVVCFPIWRSF